MTKPLEYIRDVEGVEGESHAFYAGFGEVMGTGCSCEGKGRCALCVLIYGALKNSDLVKGNVGFELLRGQTERSRSCVPLYHSGSIFIY